MWSGLFWTSPAHSKPCLIGPWTFQDRRTMCVPHSSHTGKHKRIWSGMHVTHNLHVCGSTSSHVCLSAPASSTVTLQPCARCNRRKTDSVCIKKGKSLGSKQHICVNTKGKTHWYWVKYSNRNHWMQTHTNSHWYTRATMWHALVFCCFTETHVLQCSMCYSDILKRCVLRMNIHHERTGTRRLVACHCSEWLETY